MRRKPSSQGNGGYNNAHQHKRPRYQQGGGDHRSHGSQHGRPRRNYSAAREQYLTRARDALAAGDRVAAENWFQHADHCYRMMMEEGYQQPRPQYQAQQQSTEAAPVTPPEEIAPGNASPLPAFLTANYTPETKPADPASIQNWEERDA